MADPKNPAPPPAPDQHAEPPAPDEQGRGPMRPSQTLAEAIDASRKELMNWLDPVVAGPAGLKTIFDQIVASSKAIGVVEFEKFLASQWKTPVTGLGDKDLDQLREKLVKLKQAFGGQLESYELRKEYARLFLLVKAGVLSSGTGSVVPSSALDAELEAARSALETYMQAIVKAATVPYFKHLGDQLSGLPPMILYQQLTNPLMIDIVYSYWLEMGMIYQSINAICRRFQNVDVPPLRFLNVSVLRGSAALTLLGFVEDEPHRLRPARRSAFYGEQLGVTLKGNAVPPIALAEVRTRAMEAFNEVLRLAARYYDEKTDRLKQPDPFQLVNPIKDLQLALSEGANNQFGSLTFMARVELLLIQSLLAMPEIKQFLATRDMVSYPEPWIASVDAVNRLMGWNTASALQYYELATCGERLMIALRYLTLDANALPTGTGPEAVVRTFLEKFKSDIQTYVQALYAVTGQDLGATRVALAAAPARGYLPGRAR